MLQLKLQIWCHLHNLSFSLLIPEPMCPVNTGLTWFVALQLLKRRHRRGTGDGCRRAGGSFSPSTLELARHMPRRRTLHWPTCSMAAPVCIFRSQNLWTCWFKCRFYRQSHRAEKVWMSWLRRRTSKVQEVEGRKKYNRRVTMTPLSLGHNQLSCFGGVLTSLHVVAEFGFAKASEGTHSKHLRVQAEQLNWNCSKIDQDSM